MKLTPEMARHGALILDEMHRKVQEMRGLFRLYVDGKPFELPIEGYDWQPIAGVAGVEMCVLPQADWPASPEPDADYFLTRSHLPVTQQDLVIPQAIVNEILEGELEFWKESAAAPITLYAGDCFRLQPGERHGWRAAGPFLCRISFSPKFLQA